jgi:hypothetical protein
MVLNHSSSLPTYDKIILAGLETIYSPPERFDGPI